MATRVAAAAPRIDGRLDEAAWRDVPVIGDFSQQRPIEGSNPTERTQVQVVYDADALYIGARMFRTEPGRIERAMTRRDAAGSVELLTVTFDTHLDRRTGVSFAVSAAGVRSDFRHTTDSEHGGREAQFDPVWEAAAAVDSLGWIAEIRIPFSQLRFPARPEQEWGLNIARWMPDKNEEVRWVMTPQRETGYISRFGTLLGLTGVDAVRPIELLPYVAGVATRRAQRDAADPFQKPVRARAGLDAKFGIGSNLTLDATVNPDFGQVEADPAEVNLTAFETIFEERRPFFTEGSELLRASGPNYFYSRRIGGPPHGSARGDYVDAPSASSIVGAVKLTGRLKSRLSLGGLLAVTQAEEARIFFRDSMGTRRVPLEPRTAYGVLRLQKELGAQASTLGGTFTTTRRDLRSARGLDTLVASDAYSGGLDWRLRWQQGRYALTGWAGFSHISGDAAAIGRIQRSSAHYFQRPDAEGLRYDPQRTSLTGYTASLRADKDAGRRILWGAQVIAESPGYEINDLGRLQSADDIDYNADIQIRETLPGRYLQNWRLGFDTRGQFNYARDHQTNDWSEMTRLTFLNFWSLNVRSTLSLRTTDDALTRGGPVMGVGRAFTQELTLLNAAGSRTGWRLNSGWRRDELGGSRRSYTSGITLRPAPRWQLSMDPGYFLVKDPRQYVLSQSGGRDATYGVRYMFAFVDRSTLSMRMRLNYAFSPTWTVEGYAEPFVASGRFSGFGELSAPRSRELTRYGTSGTTIAADSLGNRRVTDGTQSFEIANRDFHTRSFRSNVVMRWEWNPGSTLFFVWQQNRRAVDASGQRVRLGDLFETTRAAGDNFVSVKLSYWIPVG
ncbi:MAG: DUF5916 domain-containing protein [Gemmatimonadaceae bacterium]